MEIVFDKSNLQNREFEMRIVFDFTTLGFTYYHLFNYPNLIGVGSNNCNKRVFRPEKNILNFVCVNR